MMTLRGARGRSSIYPFPLIFFFPFCPAEKHSYTTPEFTSIQLKVGKGGLPPLLSLFPIYPLPHFPLIAFSQPNTKRSTQ
jgi:hypothetical protein